MVQISVSLAKTPVKGLVFLVALFCVSCSTGIDGIIHSDGRAELVLQSALFPGMSRLLKSLGPQDSAAPVLNAALLNAAFAGLPGIETAALGNTPSGSIEGRITVADTARFFNGLSRTISARPRVKSPPFAIWEQTANGGRFAINLNLDTGREFVSLVSADLTDYLSALMAPVATGEVIDNAGYLELVSSVYGKAVADEIGRARLSVKLEIPGPIESVTGGTYRSNRAEFDIRLVDALVLAKPLFYEIRWTAWR
jgi:hypothetical protein